MTVRRYTLSDGEEACTPDPDGAWVLWRDVEPLLAACTWRPYDPEAPPAGETLFWVVFREPDECYANTSGDPITAWTPDAKGHLHRGLARTWSALEKAAHWMPVPGPPEVTA